MITALYHHIIIIACQMLRLQKHTHTHQRARQDTCTSVLAEVYVELGLHTHV